MLQLEQKVNNRSKVEFILNFIYKQKRSTLFETITWREMTLNINEIPELLKSGKIINYHNANLSSIILGNGEVIKVGDTVKTVIKKMGKEFSVAVRDDKHHDLFSWYYDYSKNPHGTVSEAVYVERKSLLTTRGSILGETQDLDLHLTVVAVYKDSEDLHRTPTTLKNITGDEKIKQIKTVISCTAQEPVTDNDIDEWPQYCQEMEAIIRKTFQK